MKTFSERLDALGDIGEKVYEESDYTQEQRGYLADLGSSLVRGVGDVAELAGRGTGLDFLVDTGDYLRGTDVAKMDLDEKYGDNSSWNKWTTGAVRALPVTGALASSALGGPLGIAAGVGILGSGLYDQAYDEISIELPTLDHKSKQKYAGIVALAEGGTEVLSAAIPFGLSKMVSGGAKKSLAKALLKNTLLNPEKAISSAVGKQGAKKVAGAWLGSSALEGGSEVLNEIVQAEAREEYGMADRESDLFDTFMVGFLMSGAMGGGGIAKGTVDRSRIESSIKRGLASENSATRQDTFSQMGTALGAIDPSLETAWKSQYGEKVTGGPLEFSELVDPTTTPEEVTKDSSSEDKVEAITKNASAIVEKALNPRAGTKASLVAEEDAKRLEEGRVAQSLEEAQRGKAPQLGIKEEYRKRMAEAKSPLEKAEVRKGWIEEMEATEATVADVTPGMALTRDTPQTSETSGTASWKGKESTYTKNMRQKEEVEKYGAILPPAMEKEKAQWQKEGRGEWKPNDLQMIELNKYEGPELPPVHPLVAKVAEEANVTPESIDTPKFAKVTEDIEALEGLANDPDVSMEDSANAIKEVEKIRKQAVTVAKGTGKAKEVSPETPTVTPTTAETAFPDVEKPTVTESKTTRFTKEDQPKAQSVKAEPPKPEPKVDPKSFVTAPKGTKAMDGTEATSVTTFADGTVVEHWDGRNRKGNAIIHLPESDTSYIVGGKSNAIKLAREGNYKGLREVVRGEALVDSLGNKVNKRRTVAEVARQEGTSPEVIEEAKNYLEENHDELMGNKYASRLLSQINKLNKRVSGLPKAKRTPQLLANTANQIKGLELKIEKNSQGINEGDMLEAIVELINKGKELSPKSVKEQTKKVTKREASSGTDTSKVILGDDALAIADAQKNTRTETSGEAYSRTQKEVNETAPSEVEEVQEFQGMTYEEYLATQTTNPSLTTERAMEQYEALTSKQEDAFWDNANRLVSKDSYDNASAILAKHLDTYGEFPLTTEIAYERAVLSYEANIEKNKKESREAFQGVDNGKKLLDMVIAKGNPRAKALAEAINKSPLAVKKLQNIEVTVGGQGSFQRGDLINISSTALSSPTEWLHELQHGVTAREMKNDKGLNEDVTVMRRHLRNQSVKEGVLTQEQVDQIETFNGDATRFAKEFKGTPIERGYGYALVNNNEFLGQMFSSANVQELSKRTTVGIRTKTDIIQNLWKKFTDMIAKVFALPKSLPIGYETLLEQSVKVSSELYEVPYSKYASLDTNFSIASSAEMTSAEIAREAQKIEGDKGKLSGTKDFFGKTGKLGEKYLMDISTRLIKVGAPKIEKLLMSVEATIKRRNKRAVGLVNDFLKETSRIRKENPLKYKEMHIDLMENKFKPEAFGIKPEVWKRTQQALRTLHGDAYKVGMMSDYKDNYFPRRVNNLEGWMDKMYKGENVGGIEAAFSTYAKQLGKEDGSQLTPAQKAHVVNDGLSQGKFMGVTKAGASKARAVNLITPESYEFYESIEDTLSGHIAEMTEKTAMRILAGGNRRVAMVKEHSKLVKAITKEPEGVSRDTMVGQLEMLEQQINNLELDMEQGLGILIEEEMGGEPTAKQNEVQSILKARINQQGAYGAVSTMRNIGYGMVMGNITSTLTQIPEGGMMFTRFGLNAETAKAFASSLRDIGKIYARDVFGMDVGKVDALTERADFSSALREFGEDGGSAKLLDKLFTMTGLKHVDLFGKETMMRGAMSYYASGKNDAKFMERYTDYFQGVERTTQALKDIKSGKTTEDTVGVAMYELGRYQPITLSQYPEGYLTGGNGRVFYSLKGFTLRTTNAAIRDGMVELRDGTGSLQERVVKVAWAFSGVLAYYAIMGAGTDELKDLLKGRDSSFSDNVYDNLLSFALLNRFGLEKGLQSDSLLTGIINGQVPPVRWADNLLADITAVSGISDKEVKWKSISMFPLIGNMVYSRSDAGREAWSKVYRKEINEAKKEGASHLELAKMIRAYNETILDGEKRLKMSDLKGSMK